MHKIPTDSVTPPGNSTAVPTATEATLSFGRLWESQKIAVFVLGRELGSLAGNENIHCCYCWLFPVVVAGWAAVMNIYWP